jgi:1-acyl-sn-glycerol-3-phosphate acyltransferase
MTHSDLSAEARPAPAVLPGSRWTAKAVARLGLIGLAAMPLVPAQMLVAKAMPRRSHVIPRLFHRMVCRIMGVRFVVDGMPPARLSRTLVVANHISWLDISVIGSQQPLSFIAKSEIAGWPGVGMLARLQDTIFVDRSRRAATAATASQMGARLMNGDSMVLFAEGTTSDGSRIKPFRSSLLGAVKEALGPDGEGEITVQPLAVLYMGQHGIPGGRAGRARLAWYGDMALGPHVRDVLSGGPIDVRLIWGEPIRMGREHSRKEVARLAEQAIKRAAVTHFTGRSRDSRSAD